MPTPFTSSHPPLGVPGLYALAPVETPRLHPQHMDVCAFVGVAPRGPAYQPEAGRPGESGCMMMSDPARVYRRSVPVLVHSFDEYRGLFGAYEGPGYLPYAVAMFFEQGGRSAYIVRIVHEYDAPPPGDSAPWREAWARGTVGGLAAGALPFLARNEGSWGNALRIDAGYSTGALAYTWQDGEACVDRAGATPTGTLLRLWSGDGAQALSYCRGTRERRPQDFPLSRWALALDPAPPFEPVRIDTVQVWLEVRELGDDGGHGGHGRGERHQNLGLSPQHPRWLGAVLCEESQLLWPDPSWAAQELWPGRTEVELLHGVSGPFTDGRDRYGELLHEDFFDPEGLADGQDGELPRAGLPALEACPEVTHVVVPDLYVPAQWAGVDAVTCTVDSAAGAEFAACVDLPVATATIASVAPTALRQLILDPRHFADLNAIAALQQQVLNVCELRGSMIALLDVPPGLSQVQATRWRAQFGSSWGAAYHPWLVASRTVPRAGAPWHPLRPLPPSAVAAGIIARKEIERGIQFGPANEVARAIARLAEPQPAGRADVFHPLGLNCFVRGQDGVKLVSARTLSRDRAWRQLSVRRLMLMLERTLLRETRWAVFEPNGPVLWHDLQHAIDNLLLRLFRAGAWAGATPAESYFVRINREPARLERGELLVEIGVAPAEPLEFIVLCLHRDGDGTLTLER